MRLSRNLDSCHIVQVRICHRQLGTHLLKTGRLSIIQHDNSESLTRIVQIARRTNSIHNQLIFLAAACDKRIDSGNIVSCQPQLGSLSLLHGPHSPDIMHQRRNRNRNLNSDKHPCSLVRHIRCVLRPNNTSDSQSEIRHVKPGIHKSQERNEPENPSLPALPNVRVVALVHVLNGAGVDDIVLARNERRVAGAVILCRPVGQQSC